jgi:hypothetical protein
MRPQVTPDVRQFHSARQRARSAAQRLGLGGLGLSLRLNGGVGVGHNIGKRSTDVGTGDRCIGQARAHSAPVGEIRQHDGQLRRRGQIDLTCQPGDERRAAQFHEAGMVM